MDTLRRAPFGELFLVTFAVAATFEVTFALLGLVMAVLSPSMFNMNGVRATSPGAAIGVDLFMLMIMLLMNVTVSAAGAGLWTILRRFLPAQTKAPG